MIVFQILQCCNMFHIISECQRPYKTTIVLVNNSRQSMLREHDTRGMEENGLLRTGRAFFLRETTPPCGSGRLRRCSRTGGARNDLAKRIWAPPAPP